MPKLIVMMAFDHDDDGDLRPVVGPIECQSESQAIMRARTAADKHAGAIAWTREADPNLGEYGDPVELYRAGAVPDLE